MISRSKLAMGTVELGMPYGLMSPDAGQPSEKAAVKLLHAACDAGIELFDTAPGYGVSEKIVGEALGRRIEVRIATKVGVDADEVGKSIEQSMLNLQRETLDIVQIHNATTKDLSSGELMGVLEELRKQGKLKKIGASVYGEESALAAINAGVEVLQVASNLLDHQMQSRVIPLAKERNIELMIRSVYLKGVLTERGQYLNGVMCSLKEAVQQIMDELQIEWSQLSELALRYALNLADGGGVLVGISSHSELQSALAAKKKGKLTDLMMKKIKQLEIGDEEFLNPSLWPKSDQLLG